MESLRASPVPTIRQPALFISHGGGPWPYIPEMKQAFAKSAKALSELPETLPEKPKAILVISGHWEEQEVTVSTAEKPPMIYDYSGFPEHTYRVTYPASGSPELANRVRELLAQAGIRCNADATRGFDHGTFVPLVMMYPKANVPVVSLSMKSNYDPAEHIHIGEALKPLRDEGILIIGSGLSYHNMRGLRTGDGGPVSEQFERWLTETVQEKSAETRIQRLIEWEKAPAARLAHPREDHLIPLMVVAGISGDGAGERIFLDHVFNVVMASYRFD